MKSPLLDYIELGSLAVMISPKGEPKLGVVVRYSGKGRITVLDDQTHRTFTEEGAQVDGGKWRLGPEALINTAGGVYDRHN